MTAPGQPTAAPAVRRLLEERPVDGAGETWAVELLDNATKLFSEQFLLAREACAAVTARSDIAERTRLRARLIDAYNLRPVDYQRILDAALALGEAGSPAPATWAISRVLRRARTDGHRAAGELGNLIAIGIVDACDDQDSLGPRTHESPGRDPFSEVVAAAWPLVCSLELEGLRALVTEALTSERFAPLDHPVRPALQVGVALLAAARPEPALSGSLDLRRAGTRGLAFALPVLGEARFPEYVAYTELRPMLPVGRVSVLERYTQALTLTGRLAEAREMLDRASDILGDAGAPPSVRTTLLRSHGRMWRIAGDPYRSIEYSDRAVELLQNADRPLSATDRGGTWLNRAPILRELERHDEALAAAQAAYACYLEDEVMLVGQAEALQMACTCTQDPDEARRIAYELWDLFQAGRVPNPVRAQTLQTIGKAIGAFDLAFSLRVLRESLGGRATGRRIQVLTLMDGARLLLNAGHDDAAGIADDQVDAETLPASPRFWAAAAVRAALAQSNQLLAAQSRLLLARCLAQESRFREAAEVGNSGLNDVAVTVGGLTADGAQDVISELRQDFESLFDVAVELDDGALARKVAETTRGVRLAAMFRLDPTELPPAVRQALADAASAITAEQNASNPDDPDGTREIRTIASQSAAETSERLEKLCGSVIRDIAIDPAVDFAEVETLFGGSHILMLGENDGMLRWVWQQPSGRLTCGRHELTAGTRRRLIAYEHGEARRFAGSVDTWLTELLPKTLLEELAAAETTTDVMLLPAGRLWHVPFVATPLPSAEGAERALVDVARVSLAPSLRLVTAVQTRDRKTWQRTKGGLEPEAYFNPKLHGATLERDTVGSIWRYDALDGVREFGLATGRDLAILATHASSTPGMGQALIDHHGHTLTAGECLIRNFPRTVVLGTCHGYGASHDARFQLGSDPIGLLTVISARGTTWAIGGYQQIDDVTSSWILRDTYRRLGAGAGVGDALRDAQLAYRAKIASVVAGTETLPSEFGSIRGADRNPSMLLAPWYWALTIAGPPQP